MILALDPGPKRTAWLELSPHTGRPGQFGISPNDEVLNHLIVFRGRYELVCEMIASYGMPVGAEVFETCVWIGRFIQAYAHPRRTHRLARMQIKTHLCHSARAKDGNVRQALIDRFGGESAIGKKANPGPLYGISADVWAALAVAVTFRDDPSLAHRWANSLHTEAEPALPATA